MNTERYQLPSDSDFEFCDDLVNNTPKTDFTIVTLREKTKSNSVEIIWDEAFWLSSKIPT